MKRKAVVSWSGGKDSALAFYETQSEFEIVALLTTITAGYDRISVHGVRTELLERQAAALGRKLEKIVIPRECTNADYEERMRAALEAYAGQGVSQVICGDIFLEDVRRYREDMFAPIQLRGAFPLWKRDSTELAHRFLELGFRAVLCCVDTRVLDRSFAGRLYDGSLLADLPEGVDPCGENGEFHSFVFDGPNFFRPVQYVPGERVLRDNRFCFCDLLPGPLSGETAAAISLAGRR